MLQGCGRELAWGGEATVQALSGERVGEEQASGQGLGGADSLEGRGGGRAGVATVQVRSGLGGREGEWRA